MVPIDRSEEATAAAKYATQAARAALAGIDPRVVRDLIGGLQKSNLQEAISAVRRSLPLVEEIGRLLETLRAGIIADVVLLRGSLATEQERAAALDRLAEYFTRGVLFHPARWRLLEPAFIDYYREAEQTPEEAWRSLVMAGVLLAIGGLEDDIQVGGLIGRLRAAVRVEVERALLNGETLAAHGARPEMAWPENEEAVRLAPALGRAAELTLDQVQLLASLRPALENLTQRELEALLGEASDGASRVARSRAKRKVMKHCAVRM